jgi:hypothetical protein
MSTLQRRRDLIRRLYGFDFPEDLYRFWQFVNRLKPLGPLLALNDDLEIVLTGPFDILYGCFDRIEPPSSLHLHWRYYQDPPEFFTVLVGGGDGHHWGYYLDDPPKGTHCVARYYAQDALEIAADGNSLFRAVRMWIEDGLADAELDHSHGLTDHEEIETTRASMARVRQALQVWATGDRPEIGESYVERYGRLRPARFRQVVAATQEGMGIVVPPEAYRPLSLPDRQLWRRLWDTEDPTEFVEEARLLLRQGFPGTALKLGKDLWAIGGQRHQEYAAKLLDCAYAALGRDLLRQVLRTHLEHRDRPYLDILHGQQGPS